MLGTVRSGGRPVLAPAAAASAAAQRLRREPQHRREVDLLGDARAAPVAAVRERPVQRDDQPDGAGGAGPLDALQRSARGCPTSTPGRTSAGWPRRPPRSACWRTSSGPSPCRGPRRRGRRPTSPSGCTACTPVGEMSTGSEMLLPITRGGQVALGGQPGDVRREAELAERGELSRSVSPRSEPAATRRRPSSGSRLLGAPLGLGDRLEPAVAPCQPSRRPVAPVRRGHREPRGAAGTKPASGLSSQARSAARRRPVRPAADGHGTGRRRGAVGVVAGRLGSGSGRLDRPAAP